MTENHPPYPNGEHLFGPWMPKDKRHVYRVCLHPDCKHMETKEVQ